MDFRTDLALERSEIIGSAAKGIESRTRGNNDCIVTEIRVTSKEGEELIGKPVGRYITVKVPEFSSDGELLDGRLHALTEEIKNMIPEKGTILTVGLGNKSMTADALGPECAEQIFVTRHISGELADALGFRDLRPVASIAPGVLGKTGIEASEIIHGVIKKIRPVCVVAVDALAALDIERLGNTVQLSDTGISPGSGVGNKRREISYKTMGVPVISIGVPTVINALTIARNVLDSVSAGTDISGAEKFGEYVVASREADLITKRGSRLISLALNCAFQPSLTPSELLAIS